jgi:hypothetical protein
VLAEQVQNWADTMCWNNRIEVIQETEQKLIGLELRLDGGQRGVLA